MPAPRILVADDDAWILRMVTTVLEKRGYLVETASDGEEALNKALAEKPDLIVTDVMMPNMDGWALIKALRSRPELAFVPVIFLTALGSDDDRIRGFRLGADDYLPKPFRFEELDLRVAKTLKQSAMVEQMAREQFEAAPDTKTEAPDKANGSSNAGISGDLTQVGLSALLVLLEMERKSGVLVVHDAAAELSGRMFLRQGQLLSARMDNKEELVNEECVYVMLAWDAGTFEFSQDEFEMEAEIKGSVTHLLLEGARRMDEETR